MMFTYFILLIFALGRLMFGSSVLKTVVVSIKRTCVMLSECLILKCVSVIPVCVHSIQSSMILHISMSARRSYSSHSILSFV